MRFKHAIRQYKAADDKKHFNAYKPVVTYSGYGTKRKAGGAREMMYHHGKGCNSPKRVNVLYSHLRW